jgi:hypothetical protein
MHLPTLKEQDNIAAFVHIMAIAQQIMQDRYIWATGHSQIVQVHSSQPSLHRRVKLTVLNCGIAIFCLKVSTTTSNRKCN